MVIAAPQCRQRSRLLHSLSLVAVGLVSGVGDMTGVSGRMVAWSKYNLETPHLYWFIVKQQCIMGSRERCEFLQLSKAPAPPLSRPKRIPRPYPSFENTPFSRILDEKNPPLIQKKWLILRSNKTPLFEAKRDFIFILHDKIPFLWKRD